MSAPYGPPPPDGQAPGGQWPNWQPNPAPPPGAQPPPPGGPFAAQPGGPSRPVPPPGAPFPLQGPPGAQPPLPGPPAMPPFPPGPPRFEQRLTSRQRTKRMLIILPLALIAMVAFVFVEDRFSTDTDNASVGDCVKDTTDQTTGDGTRISGDNMKIVDCKDATATYKVVGKVDHVSRVEVSMPSLGGNGKGVCNPYPTASGSYWRGDADGKDGYVLCLAPNPH